jgi:hypothetical protein
LSVCGNPAGGQESGCAGDAGGFHKIPAGEIEPLGCNLRRGNFNLLQFLFHGIQFPFYG